jgi:hypothetical protein
MSAAVRVEQCLCACVRALWALIEALRADDERLAREQAVHAVDAIAAARGADNYLLLHEVGGVLHLSGRRLPLGVDVFLPAFELVRMLRDNAVGEVLFEAAVDAAGLLRWARDWVDGRVAPGVAQGAGIQVGERGAGPPPPGDAAAAGPGDSQLREVFLQHHLIAVLTRASALPPHLGKVALAAVIGHLLACDRGLEPLTLLRQDEALLGRSLAVAVLAVAIGRAYDWPEERLAWLGGAALLHDIGVLVDPTAPDRAGFAWLLERGGEPFWLQSAVVARRWREDHGATFADFDAESSLAAAIVRAAVAAEGLLGAGGGGLEQGMLAASAARHFPAELARTACAVVREMVPAV